MIHLRFTMKRPCRELALFLLGENSSVKLCKLPVSITLFRLNLTMESEPRTSTLVTSSPEPGEKYPVGSVSNLIRLNYHCFPSIFHLNQTFFFTKFAKRQIYIQVKGLHPLNSRDVKSVSCDM